MTHLRNIFPKSSLEPSWDRVQVARALRLQRHRRHPFLKAGQVLAQWAVESQDGFDARDLEIIARQVMQVEGEV